jgi:hypothetical protein
MAKILDFHRQLEAKESKESHNMWVSQENGWIIWRCCVCSRKVKLSKVSNEFVIERKGNFHAQHTGSMEPTQAS